MSERIELTKSDLIQQEKAMEEVRKLLLDRYPNRQPLAFTHSYGCQQNISDGEKIRGMLAEMGYDKKITETAEKMASDFLEKGVWSC